MKNMEIFTNNENPNHESQAEALAVIAGLISTLGGGLGTIASILALQEANQSQNNNNSNNKNNHYDLKLMQKQIDDLSKEIRQIKKMLVSRK